MKKKNVVLAGIASLALMATAAYLIVKRRAGQKEDQPPKNAPQVPINNPGDQSNFPAAPSGDTELG